MAVRISTRQHLCKKKILRSFRSHIERKRKVPGKIYLESIISLLKLLNLAVTRLALHRAFVGRYANATPSFRFSSFRPPPR
jgi:hypothetical protein